MQLSWQSKGLKILVSAVRSRPSPQKKSSASCSFFYNKTMYYVYILFSEKSKVYYVGMTKDILARLNEHNRGKSKFTKGRISCSAYRQRKKMQLLQPSQHYYRLKNSNSNLIFRRKKYYYEKINKHLCFNCNIHFWISCFFLRKFYICYKIRWQKRN